MVQRFLQSMTSAKLRRGLAVFALGLSGVVSPVVFANEIEQLYQQAGWEQQRTHFSQVLRQTQQGFKGTLPEVIYQALVENSNQRFAPDKMRRQALTSLRSQLVNPQPALAFFNSSVGQQVVQAETKATSPATLKQYQSGIPKLPIEVSRQLLLRELSEAIPYTEAGAEVALSLSSLAANSLTQMIPGVFSQEQTSDLLGTQRQRLVQQMSQDLDNTLAFVYQDLSDQQLEQYLAFAQSTAGREYFKAALRVVKTALN